MCILCVLLGQQLASGGGGGSSSSISGEEVESNALPSAETTFVYPSGCPVSSSEIDDDCLAYLATLFPAGTLPDNLIPLQTTGDGNCALHALSRSLWGVEIYGNVLRDMVFQEATSNTNYYKEKLKRTSNEWDEIVASIAQDKAFLSFEHFQLASNVLKRPIIVLASKEDILTFGSGSDGCAATFLPLKYKPNECLIKRPLLLSWSCSAKRHFVALVLNEDKTLPLIPRMKVAFNDEQEENLLFERYVNWNEKIIHSPVYKMLKRERMTQHIQQQRLQSNEKKLLELIERLSSSILQRSQSSLLKFQQQQQGEEEEVSTLHNEKPKFNVIKRENPENGELHDIVLPIQFGSKVEYISSDLNGNHSRAALNFINSHGVSRKFFNVITLYLMKAEKMLIAGKQLPNLSDVIPIARIQSEAASAILYSLGDKVKNIGIPWQKPIQYKTPPSKIVIDTFLQEIIRNGGNSDGILILINCAQEFSNGIGTGLNELQYVLYNSGMREISSRVIDHQITFQLMDILRFVILSPIANAHLGTIDISDKIAEIIKIDSTPFAIHLTFVKYLANVMSTEIGTSKSVNFRNLKEYLKAISKSTSQDLRKPLAVFLLNAIIITPFAEVSSACCEMIFDLLKSETEVSTVRTLIIALGTLVYNDEAARILSVRLGVLPLLENIIQKFHSLEEIISIVLQMCSA